MRPADPPVARPARRPPGRRGAPPPPRPSRRGRALLLAAVGVGALLLVVAIRGGDRAPDSRPAGIERFVVGTGPRAAVVVRRRGAPRQPAVIFLHGWKLLGRNAYRDWFRHLARRGVTVIAPRYQLRNGTPPEDALENALAGVRTALRRVPVRTDSVTVSGHSAGGVLAADYAAVAAGEGLPPARSVLVVYPGAAIRNSISGIPSADLSQIPSTTRLVVMASAADPIVGDGPARLIYDSATSIPLERRTFVAVDERRGSDHFAPALSTRTARTLFWRRLDRLLPAR